jgi:hypothetical protein
MGLGKKVGIVIGGLLILGVIGSVTKKSDAPSSTNVGNQGASNATEATQKPAEAEMIRAKIGDSVTVGNFIYQAGSISYKKTIGNQMFNKTADGIYLLVPLAMMNHDNKAHTLDNSFFKLTDDQGTTYESSTEGSTTLEMSGGKTLFLKQCQPNIATTGTLVFEVPSQDKVYHLKVSGGFWSGATGDITLIEPPKT